jgi:ribonuclease G
VREPAGQGEVPFLDKASLRDDADVSEFSAEEGRQRSGFNARRRGSGTRRKRFTAARHTHHTERQSIDDMLREGQEILVQVAKEPIGKKGARVTSHIALPGRYLVFMPTVDHVGVSRKIGSEAERIRLKDVLLKHRDDFPGGVIVRTAAEEHSEEDLVNDLKFLVKLWDDIRSRAEKVSASALIHSELNLVQRLLRDQFSFEFAAIRVDDEMEFQRVVEFVDKIYPNLVHRVKLYTKSTHIFDEYGITPEIDKLLQPKIWLKSGGYIVINQTEALVSIDINTGKFVGRGNSLEETITRTNLEAVKEIVKQIRLRDLGGIIVIDFIDMDERKNRAKVMQALEEAMRSDRAPYKILQFNDFGLVAITRKRVKQSLERTLCAPCPHCEGAGYVKSPQTVIGEILQEAHRIAGDVDGKEVVLRVHPDVAKALKSTGNTYLEELEEILKRAVLVTGDPLLHGEKFDLA